MAVKRRVFQVGERIKEVVADQLLRTADPRFSLVTVTSVMVAPDLRNAKVYWVVSTVSGADRKERIAEVQEAFENAEGLFRRVIGKELGIRFTPELRFYYDDTFDTVEEVERLMQKIKPPQSDEENEVSE
jgi:ribosome-binding factor A